MQDEDPYVKKTAAVCVAKLYDINPELVEDRGFLDTLRVTPVLYFSFAVALACTFLIRTDTRILGLYDQLCSPSLMLDEAG